MARPPFTLSAVRIPCAENNRHFRTRAYLDNPKGITTKNKSVCERKRCCLTSDKYIFNKRFYDTCKHNREVGHLFYMKPLKVVLPANTDKVVYVLYYFETTQNTRCSSKANVHVTNLVCVQQYCSIGEDVEYDVDCLRCGKRRYLFWNDPVGDLPKYLCAPRPGPIRLPHSRITPRHSTTSLS